MTFIFRYKLSLWTVHWTVSNIGMPPLPSRVGGRVWGEGVVWGCGGEVGGQHLFKRSGGVDRAHVTLSLQQRMRHKMIPDKNKSTMSHFMRKKCRWGVRAHFIFGKFAWTPWDSPEKTASGSFTLLRLAKVPFGRTGTGAAGKNGIKILSVMVQLSKKPQRRWGGNFVCCRLLLPSTPSPS